MSKLCKFVWRKTEWFATLTTFFVGLAVHMFGLVNVIHTGDDLWMQPRGYGSGVASGRWFLDVLGKWFAKLFGGYNLPWLNGILFIALIAVAVGFLVSVFLIENRKIAVGIGLVFVTFPTVAATMLYRFTVIYYGIAIVLAVLSAWFLVKSRYGFGPAVLCIALSTGVYQGYIPLILSILVLSLVVQVLREDVKFWEIICRGLYFCCALIVGVVLYFLVLRICLNHGDLELSSYQGINTMGELNICELPLLIYKAVRTFVLFPLEEYASLAQIELLKKAYIGVDIFSLIITVFIAVVKKMKIHQIVLLGLLGLMFPVAVNFIMVMCPRSTIHTLMVYAFATVPCFPLLLIEILPVLDGVKEKMKHIVISAAMVVIAIVVICNSYMINVNYTASYYANRQAENYYTAMIAQIRMTENFDTQKKWAVIGKVEDPTLQNAWQNVPRYSVNTDSAYLVSRDFWSQWLAVTGGYKIQSATTEEIEELKKSEEVMNMRCWPNEGSIKVVDEYLVLKFSE